MATQLHGHYQDQRETDCPGCGQRLRRKRVEQRTLTTLHGPVRLQRPYFYCRDCRIGFHPLDGALALAEEAHQYDVQEKFTRLSAKLPYHEAAAEFAELTGITVSDHLGHETLNRIAEAATLETVIPPREEIERRLEAAKAGPATAAVILLLNGRFEYAGARSRRLCAGDDGSNGDLGAGGFRASRSGPSCGSSCLRW